jgi:hypothetical protein
MKTTQYVRMERAIAAAAVNDIRGRWLWGLRLLRDPDAFSSGSSQLKPGRADELVRAANAAGLKLTVREIQFRLQCARAYPTETQIANAGSQFESWTDLRSAGFPAYEAPDGEPPADHRTEAERDHDRARALIDLIGEQGTLFPLSDFEPVVTTLKELQAYAEQMRELTSRFAERDRKRQEYLDCLIEAADGDLSMTWQDAHDRLDPDDADPAQVSAA